MIEKRLFKCDQKCNLCDLSCDARTSNFSLEDLNSMYKNTLDSLKLFDSNSALIKTLISTISLLRDTKGAQVTYIKSCIKEYIIDLLKKPIIEKDNKAFIQIHLDGFLRYTANQIIELSKIDKA